ncbi:unnamed protein product [Durusdinium trenchii]|uniref:Uncharacterized protein n=1 Tax=Durusdinium trenchii TaxID=1381693 RepID=A0ABP0PLH6_9DINO
MELPWPEPGNATFASWRRIAPGVLPPSFLPASSNVTCAPAGRGPNGSWTAWGTAATGMRPGDAATMMGPGSMPMGTPFPGSQGQMGMGQMGMGQGWSGNPYQYPSHGFKGGKGKGKAKGKGKGKSFSFSDDPRRQIWAAQRQAQQRDRAAINQAQRSAQQRFEKDLLDRVQGKWTDEEDPSISYHVEGSICSVSGGPGAPRTFRNRLSVYGGELCWDAKRFWHNLNFNALPALGEEVPGTHHAPSGLVSPSCAILIHFWG